MSCRSYFSFILILLLFAATSVAIYLCFAQAYYLIGGIGILLEGGWIYLILYRLQAVNRKLAYFFGALRNQDFSIHFVENEGLPAERLLNQMLNQIKSLFQETRLEIQQKEKYYELILASINTGVITCNPKGDVFQANRFALELLGLPVFTHLNQLKQVSVQLYEAMQHIRYGENKQVAYTTERGVLHLLIHATRVIVQGKEIRLLVLNDIENEMDEKEIDSWIRLIRVLSHEIMNSIAPITSLSDTLLTLYKEPGREPEQLRQNTIHGLEVIGNTGKSLISFVESYRKFTRIPSPVKEFFLLNEFIHRMVILCSGEPCFKSVHIQVHIEQEDLKIYADPNLLGQVVLNLMKNAIQALQDQADKQLRIEAYRDKTERIILKIIDNGPGISPQIIDEIFVPFFTTKENGSGIGLSIARQIMRIHGGNIKVTSRPGKETVFTLYV